MKIKQVLPQLLSIGLSFITHELVALDAIKAQVTPIIDGKATDIAWDNAKWHLLDHHILGEVPNNKDFQGRYKVVWDNNAIYLLAEITDDVLIDTHANPLHFYWDDDCLEVFIDEDRSGGDHLYNFNAFAYHIALDNQVVDIGTKNADGTEQFILLNDHIKSAWQREQHAPYKVIWELAISIYDDKYVHSAKQNNLPVILKTGKKMGFMLAYCDNDGSDTREHFMGSHKITPINGDKNLGYKTADVFGELNLIE